MAKKGKKVASKQAAMKARKKNRGSAVRLTEAQTTVSFQTEKQTKSETSSQQVDSTPSSSIVENISTTVKPKAVAAVQTTAFSYLRVELLHIACIAIVLGAALAVLTITLN
jgi:uncharacterized protein YecA (UPF0149 family)